jgi:hypothetical protein
MSLTIIGGRIVLGDSIYSTLWQKCDGSFGWWASYQASKGFG